METALFRIAQESMNNVAKHAHATKMRLELRRDQKSVRMLIADNGQGFSLEEIRRDAKSRTIGLRSIQERVKLLGGEVQVVTEIGKGTKISVAIPAKRSARPQARDEGRRKVGRN
jgi:NarL family two-component system sensor histidine kinase LiaS